MSRRSFWRLGRRSWRPLLLETGRQVVADEVFGRSAQIAFHAFFAVFPLLLTLTAVFGYLVDESAVLRAELFGFLRKVAPGPDVLALLEDTLDEIRHSKSGGKLSVGALVTLWSASNGMMAIAQGLNKAFGLSEELPWWRVRLTSVGTTIVFAGLVVGGLVFLLVSGELGRQVLGRLGLGGMFSGGWRLLQWILLPIAVVGAFDIVYNLSPGQRDYRWRWLTPGAILGCLLWLSASLGMRLYLHHFTYTRTYGSLGVVIILLAWFYLTGLAVLVGGEINSELWKAARAADGEGS